MDIMTISQFMNLMSVKLMWCLLKPNALIVALINVFIYLYIHQTDVVLEVPFYKAMIDESCVITKQLEHIKFLVMLFSFIIIFILFGQAKITLSVVENYP